MKTKTINQEILLIADAGLFNRQYCPKEPDNDEIRPLSRPDQLERICWAGMLSELMPELIPPDASCSKSYTWQTFSAGHFLKVNLGVHSYSFEGKTSIDPYLFLAAGTHIN